MHRIFFKANYETLTSFTYAQFFILINRVSLRKDLGYNFKKYGKKMLMLDYHSVQCS